MPSLKKKSEALWSSLQEQLPASIVASLNAGWNEIMAAGVENRCLRAGDTAPEFVLPSVSGDPVSLHGRLSDGPVVLVFYRGSWCPYCDLALREYHRALPEIQAAGASLLMVSPQTLERARDHRDQYSLGMELLCDEGCGVAERYGLAFSMPQTHVRVLEQVGQPLAEANGSDSDRIPLTATYIVVPGGTIAWAHIDPNYRLRAEVRDIVSRLQELG